MVFGAGHWTGVGFYVPLCFISPNYQGDIISSRYGCFGDVKQIPNYRDINPNPCWMVFFFWGDASCVLFGHHMDKKKSGVVAKSEAF